MRKIIMFSLISIAYLMLNACDKWGEDFFDGTLQSTRNLDPEIRSNAEYEGILNGAFHGLKSAGPFGVVDAVPALREIIGDLVNRIEFSNTRTQFDIELVWNRDVNNADIQFTDMIWQSGYQIIQAVNTVIEFYENNEPFADNNSPANINRMLGEAHFMRAYAHFQLSLVFSPPFNSKPNDPGVILLKKPALDARDLKGRVSVREVYEAIVSDLKTAIALLPAEFDGSIHPPAFAARANKNAAMALLARVYFLMGENHWGALNHSYNSGSSTALGLINDLESNNRLKLADDVFEVWSFLGAPFGKSDEAIWAHAFFNPSRGNRMGRFFTRQETGNARFMRQFHLSEQFIERLGWDEVEEAVLDKRYNQLFRRFFPNAENPQNRDPDFQAEYTKPLVWGWKGFALTQNTPILRSPEMYLTRAAILVNQPGEGKAKAMGDINKIRVRAGLEPLSDVNLFSLDDVETEWIKELGFEGLRLNFLQALKMNIGSGGRDGVGAVPHDSPTLYFTIPRREVELNPNLQ
ncbi:MAG: RagB/SusD family nutrient uptake outer membrane protein [Cyclobacteriaceae bacterium]|nr:RagB/SusD family nutrient uptake outer membrane protein [Cyclobacteriaceae bacterium]